MKSDLVGNSGNDEFYTPAYAIAPLIPFLAPGAKVWCPFDTAQSLYVKMLRAEGYEVTHTHLDDGGDFFRLIQDPPECDYIVSNPPYSLKGEVLAALFASGKPFAMLVAIVGLFESQKRFEMFARNQFEVLYFNRRVAYFRSYSDAKPALNPPFSSAYVCSGVLPDRMVFREVDKSQVRPENER